jgi:hypothetical protein
MKGQKPCVVPIKFDFHTPNFRLYLVHKSFNLPSPFCVMIKEDLICCDLKERKELGSKEKQKSALP